MAADHLVPPRPPTLGRDLEEAGLEGLEDHAVWEEREIRGSAVAVEAEQVAISGCRMVGVRLAGARLRGLDLTDVEVTDADLAGLVVGDAAFTRVTFTQCRLTGADLGGACLTDVRFTDCQLDEAGLRMVRATRLAVSGGSAGRVDLYRAKLAQSSWSTDLTGADLSGSDLVGAHFGGSTIADLTGAAALRGTVIAPDQTFPVGLALIADAAITIAADPT